MNTIKKMTNYSVKRKKKRPIQNLRKRNKYKRYRGNKVKNKDKFEPTPSYTHTQRLMFFTLSKNKNGH